MPQIGQKLSFANVRITCHAEPLAAIHAHADVMFQKLDAEAEDQHDIETMLEARIRTNATLCLIMIPPCAAPVRIPDGWQAAASCLQTCGCLDVVCDDRASLARTMGVPEVLESALTLQLRLAGFHVDNRALAIHPAEAVLRAIAEAQIVRSVDHQHFLEDEAVRVAHRTAELLGSYRGNQGRSTGSFLIG